VAMGTTWAEPVHTSTRVRSDARMRRKYCIGMRAAPVSVGFGSSAKIHCDRNLKKSTGR
jgi:hypothetical protein